MVPELLEHDWNQSPESIKRFINGLLGHIQEQAQTLEELRRETSELASIMHVVCKHVRRRVAEPRTAVFITKIPGSREAKLAYGLKSLGWKVYLLAKAKPWFDASRYFEEVHIYSTPLEALLLASGYSPIVYHVFASWRFELAKYLIWAKPGVMVFDDYDVFSGSLTPEYEKTWSAEIPNEKYCLENADGLCNRSLTFQIPKRLTDYSLTKAKLFFPDYCSGAPFQLKPKRTDGVHIVYIGSWDPTKFDDPDRAYCNDREFIEALTASKIHYHCYPGWDAKDLPQVIPQWIELAARNEYFHVHDPLPYEQLIPEISQYHLGIGITRRQTQVDGYPYLRAAAVERTLSNKFFDYLEAGLGNVFFPGRLAAKFFVQKKVAMLRCREDFLANLDAVINFALDPELQRNIAAARTAYGVRRHAPRLAAFYEKLYAKAGSQQVADVSG